MSTLWIYQPTHFFTKFVRHSFYILTLNKKHWMTFYGWHLQMTGASKTAIQANGFWWSFPPVCNLFWKMTFSKSNGKLYLDMSSPDDTFQCCGGFPWNSMRYGYKMNIKNRWVNTLRLKWNEQHLTDYIFKGIFFNENVWTSSKISLKFVPKGPINSNLTLVQIMTCHRLGDKSLLEQWCLVYQCIYASLDAYMRHSASMI